jgi:hypothetical protein
MGKAIPTQHPAVVLRSHYLHLRALLAVALIALVGLTGALVILAINDDGDAVRSAASPQAIAPAPKGSTRYDGGPEEGTADVSQAQARVTQSQALPGLASQALEATQAPAEGTRYDGGPEEGTSGALSSGADSNAVPGIRYDGGPEEGSSGAGH